MNRSYFYFAASLPMLDLDGPPPFSVEDFLGDAKRLLEPDDHRLLESLLTHLDHPAETYNPVVNQWARFIKDFRNEQAWFRAERAGKDPMDYIRGERYPDPYLNDVLQQAFKAEHPLEAERILDRFKWGFLDEMEAHNPFNFGYIIIFGLKLQILERYDRIDTHKGEEKLKEMCHESCAALSETTGESHSIAQTVKEREGAGSE